MASLRINWCISLRYKKAKFRDFRLGKNHARIQRGNGFGSTPSLGNHNDIGFLSNTGSGPLKNHKATKPAFNGLPLSGV